MKEGDTLTFATEDDSERTLWVQAVYRATGQTHKPTPPVQQTNKISNTQISRMQGGGCLEGGGGDLTAPCRCFTVIRAFWELELSVGHALPDSNA